MDALSKIGRNDLAGKLLLNEDFPGWLYEVRCGATTMWERWDSVRPDGSFDESGMNSFNHYAFGAVGDWLLEQLVGIRPAEPGYRAITLQPQLIQGITQACAMRTTPYGRVRLAWQCLNHLITVEVEIPANTTAQLFLPEQEGSITLGSGSYRYSYATETDLTPQRFTMDTPLRTMLADADAKAVLSAALPGYAGRSCRRIPCRQELQRLERHDAGRRGTVCTSIDKAQPALLTDQTNAILFSLHFRTL